MRIVVLDGYVLNPGDLSWSALEALGTVELHDRTAESEVVKRAAGAQVVLTNKTPLSAASLAALPDLRYIGVLATGYNIVDVKAAKERGITVSNIPTYGTNSVAQLVFALLLELCHHAELHSQAVKAGEWSRNADWTFWKTPLIELAGRTMGIIGFGRIGRQVGRIADAMGMRVVANDEYRGNAPEYPGFAWMEIDELLAASDVVSLHCPLTPSTNGLINSARIATMKRSAFLINTSRGPLIVEKDLAAALEQSALAGAGIDVLPVEPPPADSPLFKAPNCVLTPHMAWATKEARGRLMQLAVDNIQAFVAGTPVNVVS